ncbi:unnamed protein product [Brassicogethes aeneus]|uniref:Uncharacterized protein n=1 Tax=Brassicogethes aeneus TaxID=1431903 RepID=A0A9P0ASL3_BRAAE|nr:unnamed protein product [Brassicogethes aeneus]
MNSRRIKRILQMVKFEEHKQDDSCSSHSCESNISEYPSLSESLDFGSDSSSGMKHVELLKNVQSPFPWEVDYQDIGAIYEQPVPSTSKLIEKPTCSTQSKNKILDQWATNPSSKNSDSTTPPIENNITTVKASRIRRKHVCSFCELSVTNFARHLERNHADELQVQQFMSLDKKSSKRKKLLDKIRREGDFSSSEIVPVMKLQHPVNDYIVCTFCRGYYSKTSLRKHTKNCFFNPDPSLRFNAQIEGQTFMAGPFGPHDPLKQSGLLSALKADEISLIAKKDPIICEVARRYLKSHREKHLVLVAKRHMRRLARLLLNLRELERNPKLTIIDFLKPQKFQSLVKATLNIAEYNKLQHTFKSPSLALQMGTLIKQAIHTAYSYEAQKTASCKDRLENFNMLTTLIESDWAHEVSSRAGQNLAINRFNKPSVIPVAKDIKTFDEYLKNLMREAQVILTNQPDNSKAYRDLMDGVFCSIVIFNKRRAGEMQRIYLSTFLQNYDSIPFMEFEKALTNSEKILYRSLKRVVIRGKRGRGVPVLFDKETVKYINFLVDVRKHFNLSENPYLFGVPGRSNPIHGYGVIRKHALAALGNKEKASLLTSTKLRKHLATITQIFKMEKNELEQLATFMGHTEKTHSEFYRLPDDVYQTAKVSKILLLSKTGDFERYKGKRLEEIEIDSEIIEENEDEDQEEYIETFEDQPRETENAVDVNASNISATKNIKKGSKRTLVRWTEEQRKLTEDFFKDHIMKRKAPKKHEVLNLIENHPSVFQHKTWPVVKVYVCNKFKKL